jgi:urease accessory protein
MDIIHAALSNPESAVLEVVVPVDRLTLAKLRWRATAEDGREYGFDLAEPLRDNSPFFHIDGTTYIVSQRPEPVLEISLAGPEESARLGWLIGNLHFPLELCGDFIRVADDSALSQMLQREHIPCAQATRVFHPMRQAHAH